MLRDKYKIEDYEEMVRLANLGAELERAASMEGLKAVVDFTAYIWSKLRVEGKANDPESEKPFTAGYLCKKYWIEAFDKWKQQTWRR